MTAPRQPGQNAALRRLAAWWREDRPVYWGWHWRWGWLGNGWNGLHLGPLTIWFKSGPSPLARLVAEAHREEVESDGR